MQPGKFPEGISGGSDHLWFLDTSVVIRVRHTDGADQISVLEHLAPYGDSPPLHLHQDEDEIFHVLEGELRFRVGAEDLSLKAGDTLLAPKRVPHTYKVESIDGARFLTVTRGGGFEGLVQEFGRHAEHAGLPDPAGPPTPEQAGALADACLRHGIELVGPPLA
jgi:quercetin dioxygenase-like cupin family protein